MDINITGNPGTGNTFQEINIGTVQNYTPNATTVINHNYGDTKQQRTPAKETSAIDKLQRTADIINYVGNLKQYVSPDWHNRYETLWRNILAIHEVEAQVYAPGKQKDTSFNRNLVANIICVMKEEGVFTEQRANILTEALEGDREHSVRAQLGSEPSDKEITRKVKALLEA